MTFHREGYTTLALTLTFDAVIIWAAHAYLPTILAWALTAGALVLLLLVVNFFRYPNRPLPDADPRAVICPSDGKVVVMETVEEAEWFGDRRIQVSIFMSPLNVHAQWAPISGKTLASRYHSGKYLVAWHPKSSSENERTTHVVEGEHGTVLFRQIAGAVARRICWYMKTDQPVKRGDEVGFIKFGSRIDVFLPLDAQIQVGLNQNVVGRETVLALL